MEFDDAEEPVWDTYKLDDGGESWQEMAVAPDLEARGGFAACTLNSGYNLRRLRVSQWRSSSAKALPLDPAVDGTWSELQDTDWSPAAVPPSPA